MLTIAGVSGGVGTSTITRMMNGHLPVQDSGRISPDLCPDILIVGMTAASSARLPSALAICGDTRPVLVVSHTTPGPAVRLTVARVRAAEAHVWSVVHVPYVPNWVSLDAPPGLAALSKALDGVRNAIRAASEQRSAH